MFFQPASWQSQDGIYKLASRWEGDDLQYLSPDNRIWVHLATKVDSTFVIFGQGQKKVFKRIQVDEIANWNKDIVKSIRPVFDYKSVAQP